MLHTSVTLISFEYVSPRLLLAPNHDAHRIESFELALSNFLFLIPPFQTKKFTLKNTTFTSLAVASRGGDAASAATMGLALTYAQSITQILNFLIRVTAELEVNVSR